MLQSLFLKVFHFTRLQ